MCVIDLSSERVERYWAKVKIVSDGCWMWTGSLDRKGYGNFTVAPRRANKAHIYGYYLAHGPVPDGMHVDHTCNTPGCQNPAHLRVLTNVENNARSTSPSALNARKTHCVNGHEFTEDNIIRFGDGYRRCRTCAGRREQVAA